MARIRSVHPGLTTDEAFMAMSAYAKAAWAPLWTECDDRGVFEWKPIVLKARLLPADNVSFDDILSEWERLDVIRRFEACGKTYGAVRNFQKFQRPKKPQAKYPLPDALYIYVGTQDRLSPPSSEPVPPSSEPVPQNAEKSPQMEDGGGNGKDNNFFPTVDSVPTERAAEPPPDSLKLLRKELWDEGKQLFRELKGCSDGTAGGLVTKLVKASGNNFALCLTKIRDCKAQAPPPLDPFSWLMARVGSKQAEREEAEEKQADEAWRRKVREVENGQQNRDIH